MKTLIWRCWVGATGCSCSRGWTPLSFLLPVGNSCEDSVSLLLKWPSVREAGAIFVWPLHRHLGAPISFPPRRFAYTLPFEFLCCGAGANFLPSGQGMGAHSVAGVRWQSPVPQQKKKKKATEATLSARLLPAFLLSVVPFCPSRRFEA